MKKVGLMMVLMAMVFAVNHSFGQNRPTIEKASGEFYLEMDMSQETPLVFGYEKADVSSKKMICFSEATADVEGNPHKCELGAYYETMDIHITYVGMKGDFVELKFNKSKTEAITFYMEKSKVNLD